MPKEKKNAPAPYELIGALLATARLHRKHAEHIVSSTSLHPTQHRVIMYLSRRNESTMQREIANQFELTPAAVVQIVDRLEEGGYVMRVLSETDSRCKYVSLTEKGKKTAADSARAFQRIDTKSLSGISEEELDVFRNVLLRMQENMKE